MKKNPKSARDTNIIIKWQTILKVRKIQKRNSQMRETPESSRDTNVIIET